MWSVIFCIINIPNKKELLTFGVIIAIDRSECLAENKNVIKTFWGWNLSINKNIEPHQKVNGS